MITKFNELGPNNWDQSEMNEVYHHSWKGAYTMYANDANWCLHCGANGFCWSFNLNLYTTNMRNKLLKSKYDLIAGI